MAPATPTDLTVVLTLKGRQMYTRRWLAWMATQGFEHHILLADGGEDDDLQRRIEASEFAKLSVEYVRYPADKGIPDFMRKVGSATGKVRTPFAMLADNDDFILRGPLNHHLAVLRSNASLSFVSAPHYRVAFDKPNATVEQLVYPHPGGIVFRKLPDVRDPVLLSDDPVERCVTTVRRFHSEQIAYGIHRTENLARIGAGLARQAFTRITFYEWFLIYGLSAAGKGDLHVGEPFLVRQAETSSSAAPVWAAERFDNIYLLPDWTPQLYSMIESLHAECVARGSTVSREEFDRRFLDAFRTFLLSWNQFRGVADRFKHFGLAYSLGRFLFQLYRGKGRRPPLKRGELIKSPDVARLIDFLEAGRPGG